MLGTVRRLCAVVAAGVLAAGGLVATSGQPAWAAYTPSALAITGSATCRNNDLSWSIRWRLHSHAGAFEIVAVTDPETGTDLSSAVVQEAQDLVVLQSRAGDATTVALAVTVRYADQPGTSSSYTASFPLGRTCLEERDPGTCTMDPEFPRTWDGASSTVSLTLQGKLPCDDSNFYAVVDVENHIEATGLLALYSTHRFYVPGGTVYLVGYAPAPACQHRVRMWGTAEPSVLAKGSTGTCTAPAASARSTCRGDLILLLTNGSAAALPVSFDISYYVMVGGQAQYTQVGTRIVRPGQTTLTTIVNAANPTKFVTVSSGTGVNFTWQQTICALPRRTTRPVTGPPPRRR